MAELPPRRRRRANATDSRFLIRDFSIGNLEFVIWNFLSGHSFELSTREAYHINPEGRSLAPMHI